MPEENPLKRSAAVFFLAVLAIYFRAPDRVMNGYLWAEDVAIFMAQAREFGLLSFKVDYAGYLHFIPRLIAWAQFRTESPVGAPYFFMIACALLTAGACAYIAAVVRLPVAAAIMMGLSPVLSPQNGEVLLTITNLQWMLFPCLLVLLWECLFKIPSSAVIPRVVVTVALTLTGPFGVLVWPIALLAAIRSRKELTRVQMIWLLAYTAAVFLQAWTMVMHPAPSIPPGHINWVPRMIRELFSDLLPGAVPGLFGVAIGLLLLCCVAVSRTALMSIILCGIGVAIWALGVYRVNGSSPSLVWYGAGCRYIYLPLLFFLWSAILSTVTAPNKAGASASAVMAAIILLASASRFGVSPSPPWSIQRVPSGYEVKIPPGWEVFLPNQKS